MADIQMAGTAIADARPQKRKSEPEPESSEMEDNVMPNSKRPRRPPTPFRTRPTITLKTGCVTPTIIPHSKKPKNPRRDPLPVLFLALPRASSADKKTVANPFVVAHDKSTILTANALAEHHQKYGGVAMPDQDSLRAWLEENKREFARARLSRRAAKQRIQRLQVVPRPAQADAPVPVPAAAHPAVRPDSTARHPAAQAANGGIVRLARKYCRKLVEGIANHLGRQIYTDTDVEEDRLLARVQQAQEDQLAGPAGQEVDAHLERVLERAAPVVTHTADVDFIRSLFDDEMDTDSESEADEDSKSSVVPPTTVSASASATVRQSVNPVMPPPDPRFFHPDGRLHGVYKYLTAQIPLPRQWVEWALKNGIHHVHGRGNIRRKGTYVADDTFDYDALHRVIHSGAFRTGCFEIDTFPHYWPLVKDQAADRKVAHYDHLERFPPRAKPSAAKPGLAGAKAAPNKTSKSTASRGSSSAPNRPRSVSGVSREQRPGTFGLSANFYDDSSSSDSDSESALALAPMPEPRRPVTNTATTTAPVTPPQGSSAHRDRSPSLRNSLGTMISSVVRTLRQPAHADRPAQAEQPRTRPQERRPAQLQASTSQPAEQSQRPQTPPQQRRSTQPLAELQGQAQTLQRRTPPQQRRSAQLQVGTSHPTEQVPVKQNRAPRAEHSLVMEPRRKREGASQAPSSSPSQPQTPPQRRLQQQPEPATPQAQILPELNPLTRSGKRRLALFLAAEQDAQLREQEQEQERQRNEEQQQQLQRSEAEADARVAAAEYLSQSREQLRAEMAGEPTPRRKPVPSPAGAPPKRTRWFV